MVTVKCNMSNLIVRAFDVRLNCDLMKQVQTHTHTHTHTAVFI